MEQLPGGPLHSFTLLPVSTPSTLGPRAHLTYLSISTSERLMPNVSPFTPPAVSTPVRLG